MARSFLSAVLTALLSGLFSSTRTEAQYVGLSAFGSGATHSLEASHPFPCDKYLAIATRPANPAMAILWGTFGDDLWCPIWFMQAVRDRGHLLQIHISNESGRKKNNLGVGELSPFHSVSDYNEALEAGELEVHSAARERVKEILAFVRLFANENTAVILSLGLEDQYTDEAYEALRQTVLDAGWPYGINRNPLGNRHHIAGWDYREKHGDTARCSSETQMVNEDGSVQTLRATKKWLDRNKSCLVRFVWRAEHQGRTKSGRPVYPRRARSFHISDKDVRELGDLLSRY